MLYASFLHIVLAKQGQASAGDNEVKLMMKHAPRVGSNQQPSDHKSSTLPLDYRMKYDLEVQLT